MYSAIKHKGRKLYELARQGVEIDLPDRKVHVYEIELLDYIYPNRYFIEVTCSKGTYIRSICRDMGNRLGCGGLMSFLLRCRTGMFSLENSFTLEEITDAHMKGLIENLLVPIDAALPQICHLYDLTPSATIK
jgi:tRNA pseudouridine55 synthase